MEQPALLRYAIEVLERHGIDYALVGSLASSLWGEVRFTNDIDIVVRVSENDVESICSGFAGDQFYVSSTAAHEARQRGGQFKVIVPATGNKIDFMVLGESPWSQEQFGRRRRVITPAGCQGYVCAPEDVILGKLIYLKRGGSDKHLRYISGILTVIGANVEHDYLERWSTEIGVDAEWKQALGWHNTGKPT